MPKEAAEQAASFAIIQPLTERLTVLCFLAE